MTKRTRTKIAREYELDKRGKPLKRLATPLAPAKSHQVPCPVCRKPINAFPGQVVRFHKACRKNRGQYKAIIDASLKKQPALKEPEALFGVGAN